MRHKRRCVRPDKVRDKIACAPSFRLRDLLRLGNNPTIFRNLKQQLYRLAEKHLNVEYCPRAQTKDWAALEAELLSTLPDLFDCRSAETFELALLLVASYHYRRRNAFKQKNDLTVHFPRKPKSVTVPTEAVSNQQIESNAHSPKKRSLVMSVSVPTRAVSEREREAAKNREEIDIIDLTLDHDEKQKNDIEFVEPKLPLTMDISNRLSGPATIKRSHSTSPGPSTLRSPAALINSQNTPLHAESSSQARSSKSVSFKQGNHEDVFQLTGVTRVARFLNACHPPMAHFLQPFIDFGCTGEEYLVTVSTWPPDKISHFLSRVVRHRKDEREFSPMEMLILQNHFISYFNKAQT